VESQYPCGVQKNLPPFTLRLFAGFVNDKTHISTGFLGFFRNFAGFWSILRLFAEIQREIYL
jgi:hypothetical protein